MNCCSYRKEQEKLHSKRLCLVTTTPYAIEMFLLHQLERMEKLYDVTVITNTTDVNFLEAYGLGVKVLAVPIERKISLVKDLRALIAIYHILRRGSFSIVHSVTPKAGLLSMLAAWYVGVPIRLHTFTGQLWNLRVGLMQSILKVCDRLTVIASTGIIVDSFSQREFLIRERVVSKDKARVLAHGSLGGVNSDRFRPNQEVRLIVRRELGIGECALVFLYMARLTRDKGALVMAKGFADYCARGGQDGHLIIVGPDEEGLRDRMREICKTFIDRVHFVDLTKEPEKYMAAADVFCLPSYREGFGTAIINAASVGIPTIASRIYGSLDAMEEGRTGLMHDAGNYVELASRMHELGNNPQLRSRLGENGRLRAAELYDESIVSEAVLAYYREMTDDNPSENHAK